MEKELFWADKIAELITNRKKYNYVNKKVISPKQFTIKSSTSISGVPHIGNASDVIRHYAVVKALKDKGKNVNFIWVAEDMDALRKVPASIPKEFKKYLGMPVADIPCPNNCCKNYTHHFSNLFVESLKDFGIKVNFLSTADTYRKGEFTPFIKKVFEKIDVIKNILNKSRQTALGKDWNPWKPICQNCGKLMTTKTIGNDKNSLKYSCEEYEFKPFGEKTYTKLKGCGYKGESDIENGNGKLLWRVEWGMLWAAWKVVFEGAGKEHFMPSGSFWSAGEITEKVFEWPEPYPGKNSIQPYEYITINGEKMSASKGNVVATWDWTNFSPPQILKLIFLKKPNKVRDFSYQKIPEYVDEYDRLQRIYFGIEKIENEKELEHLKRLYEMTEIKIPEKIHLNIPFVFASMIAQIAPEDKMLEKAISLLQSTGHVSGKMTEKDKKTINFRLQLAKKWVEKYADERYKIELVEKPILTDLSEKQKQGLKILAEELGKKTFNEQELYNRFYKLSEEVKIEPKELFSAVYKVLLNKNFGPRLAPFILTIGQKKVAKKLASL